MTNSPSPSAAVALTRSQGYRRLMLWALGGLSALLVASMVAAIGTGAMKVSLAGLLADDLGSIEESVLWSIRLPRAVLAAVVGAALGVSGAAMQGLLRNSLADPGLLGISSGGALAVGVLIVVAQPSGGAAGLYGLSVGAFAGSLLASMFVFQFSGRTGGGTVVYVILAGIAVNALAGAATGFLTYLSDDQQLRALTFWAMGSLGGALWPAVLVASSIVVPATIVQWLNASKLNVLLLGESEARYLGVDDVRLKKRVLVCTALSVGAAVAVSGVIGFVGLVVPHLIRLAFGPDHRLLIPASALLGAALLVAADTVARIVVAPAELPVGIVTSLIGGPFFLWLLIGQYRRRAGA